MVVTGVHGRGGDHIEGFSSVKQCKIIGLCDVDENVLKDRINKSKAYLDPSIKLYKDFKEVIADKDVDAVSIATPNHWHSIMGIWACQANKDVYVEKPLSHNIFEGRKLVEAARKYNRVVQHGTQSRSSIALQEAMDHIKKGTIGEVYYAKGTCYKWRDTIKKTPESEPPAGVDYNLWQGPAPEKPFTKNHFHYNWHWFWDYGNGDIGNQGVHEMDIARWGLGVGHPTMIQAMGDHFMFDDDQETPNTMIATFKYPNKKMFVFEVRHWMTNNELELFKPGENVVGNLFLGSEGIMLIKGYNHYEIYLGKGKTPGPKRIEGGSHYQNFIDCVISRKKPNADVEDGHYASALCHLANAAYRAQSTLQFDPEKEVCTNNPQADDILQGRSRKYRTPFTIPETI